MIRSLATSHAELEVRMSEELDSLHQQRTSVAIAWELRLGGMKYLIENMRTDAAEQDLYFADAIARKKAMIGAPEQLKAAE